MSEINQYPQDLMPDDGDKVIGTRKFDGKTLNYTLLRVANYLSMNGYADPSRSSLTLQFSVLTGGDTQPEFGSAVIPGNLTETVGFADISTLRVTYKNNNNVSFRELLEYFEGGDIKIQSTQGADEKAYGIYTINSINNVDENYADLSLSFISGPSANNTVSDGSYISISALSAEGTDAQPAQLRHGAGVPAANIGNDGDFYLDTTNYDIYGPKANGAWGSGFQLKGDDGTIGVHGTSVEADFNGTTALTITTTTYDQDNNPTVVVGTPVELKGDVGEKGSKGATILNGSGTPGSSLGRSGDYYIDNTSQTLFVNSNGFWSSLFVIKGDTGQAGQKGNAGQQGPQGVYNLEIFRPSALELSGAPVGGSWNGVTLTPPAEWYANYSSAVAAAAEGDTVFESRASFNPAVDTFPFTPVWGLAFPAGAQGATGQPGETGPQGPGYSNVTLTNNGDTLNFIGQDTDNVSVTGVKGDDGASGRGITSITLVSTVDGLKTYRVDFTDGLNPFPFTTQDGTNGTDGATWHGVLDRAPNNNEFNEGDFTVSTISGVTYIYGPQHPDGSYDSPEQITGKDVEFNQDVTVSVGAPESGGHASVTLDSDLSDNTKNVYDLSLTIPQGMQGVQGAYNVSIFISSAAQPVITTTSSYDLEAGAITGIPTGWSSSPVTAAPGQIVWESRAIVDPIKMINGDVTLDWSPAFQAGEAGPTGNGISSIVAATLTDEEDLSNGTFNSGDTKLTITETNGVTTIFGIEQGRDGESAYDIYVSGFTNPADALSEIDWLQSLQGMNGEPGVQGISRIEVYISTNPGTTPPSGVVINQNFTFVTIPGGWKDNFVSGDYVSFAFVNPADFDDTPANYNVPDPSWSEPFQATDQGPTGPQGPVGPPGSSTSLNYLNTGTVPGNGNVVVELIGDDWKGNVNISGKEDTISDLGTIRSGAEAGATALQPDDVEQFAKDTTTRLTDAKLPTDVVYESHTQTLTNKSISADQINSGELAAARIPNLDASKIDSGTLATGRIPDLDASKVASGTLSVDRIPNLDASKIDAGTLATERIPDLDASKITSGTLDDGRIPNLNASKTNAGQFSADRIPNLSTGKITSGTFTQARIPDLDTGKITSGTFVDARIPNLNASKTNAGTFDAARIPDLPQSKITDLTTDLSNKLGKPSGNPSATSVVTVSNTGAVAYASDFGGGGIEFTLASVIGDIPSSPSIGDILNVTTDIIGGGSQEEPQWPAGWYQAEDVSGTIGFVAFTPGGEQSGITQYAPSTSYSVGDLVYSAGEIFRNIQALVSPHTQEVPQNEPDYWASVTTHVESIDTLQALRDLNKTSEPQATISVGELFVVFDDGNNNGLYRVTSTGTAGTEVSRVGISGGGIHVETAFPTSPTVGDHIFLDVAVSITDGTNQRPRGLYTYVQPGSNPNTRFWEPLTIPTVGQLFNTARVGDVIYLENAEDDFNTADNDFVPGFYRATATASASPFHTTWTAVGGSGTTINSIGDIADVDITGAAEGDILQRHTYHNGTETVTEWVNTQGLVSVQQNIAQILDHQAGSSTITLSETDFPGLSILRNTTLFSNQDGEKSSTIQPGDEAPRFYSNIGQMSLAYTGLNDTQIQEIQNLVGQDVTFRHSDDGSLTDQTINDANSFHFRVVDWIYRGATTRRLDLSIRDTSQQADFLAKFAWTQDNANNWYISTGTNDITVTDLLAQISVAVYIPVGGGTTVTGQTVRNLDTVTGFAGNLEGIDIGGNVYNIPLTSTQLTSNAQTIPTGGIAIVDDELQYYNVSGSATTGVTLTTDFSGSGWSVVGRDHVFVRSEDTAAWGALAAPQASLGKNGNIAFNDQDPTSVTMYHKNGGVWGGVTIATSGTAVDGWENSTGSTVNPNLRPVATGQTADINGNGGTLNISDVGSLTGHTTTGMPVSNVSTINGAPVNALEKIGYFLGTAGVIAGVPGTANATNFTLGGVSNTYSSYTTRMRGVNYVRYFYRGIETDDLGALSAGRGVWSNKILTAGNLNGDGYINLIG